MISQVVFMKLSPWMFILKADKFLRENTVAAVLVTILQSMRFKLPPDITSPFSQKAFALKTYSVAEDVIFEHIR